MGTKNNPGAFDCYANAEPDEPMFVLLGRDRHAPALVWLWSVMRELDEEDPTKVLEARQCVSDMLLYAQQHDRKPVGLGNSVLAGTLELIRAANFGSSVAMQNGTPLDVIRAFFATTTFPPSEVASPEASSGE